MAFELPKLAYGFDELEPYIDRTTMTIHHGKHHATYVEKLNTALEGEEEFLKMDINELMRKIEDVPEKIRTQVRNHGGGHANHSLFWTVMAPKAGGIPEGEIVKVINDSFGNFNLMKEQFTEVAKNIFGSGWAWLVIDNGKLKVASTANQDSPFISGMIPVLGLDVWEHAYYLKYQNRRPEYIDAWWNVVNWNEVEKRYKEATK